MKWVIVIMLLLPFAGLAAQDDFGFGDTGLGFDDSDGFGFPGGGSSGFSVKISGEVGAELKGFYDDFSSEDKIENMRLGDIFSGRLNFEAGNSAAQGVINLKLKPVFDGASPVEIDEAFVRAFFGPVTVEGGFRKLTWGKADSFGPMDVVNPLDYKDLTKLSDPKSVKIARPMLRTTLSMGSFTKVEAVFVPWFQGHKFATNGRWAPNQVKDLRAGANAVMDNALFITSSTPDPNPLVQLTIMEIQGDFNRSIDDGNIYPQTNTLKYAQAGIRFTTTVGSSDLGLQYYFGRFPRPVIYNYHPEYFLLTISPAATLADLHPELLIPNIDYNYYHQIAADFARVVAGFNIRAEAGVNLTKDLDGTDGAVENPAIVWSLGFDRDLVWSINLNLQGTGRFRLFHDKIGGSMLTDCEA